MNTPKLLVVAATVAAGATLFATTTFAQSTSTPGTFRKTAGMHLTQEQEDARRTERNVKANERLDTAVQNGILTEAQKQALIAKRQENQTEHAAKGSSINNFMLLDGYGPLCRRNANQLINGCDLSEIHIKI